MKPAAPPSDELPLLQPRAAGATPARDEFELSHVPALLEYAPLGKADIWRVADFSGFVTEFNFGPWARKHGSWERAMIVFHEAAHTGYSRGWQLARQLFGITTMILPANAHPDEGRVFTRPELYATHGLDRTTLAVELDALRAITRLVEQSIPAPEAKPPPAAPQAELELDDALLKRHGFEESMFEVMLWKSPKDPEVKRAADENKRERDWFVKRVRDWDRMLSEPFAHSTARDALLTDLYLHRVAIEMAPLSVNSPRFKELGAMKQGFEKDYRSLRQTLQEWFPQMNIAGRDSAQVNFSDIYRGYIEYKNNGDHHLLDRVRTALECELDIAQSLQQPDPAYRFGQTTYIIEAIHNLTNPEWRSQMPHRVLRALDLGFQHGVEQARKEQGKPLVDLSKGVMRGEGGANSDFPELGAE